MQEGSSSYNGKLVHLEGYEEFRKFAEDIKSEDITFYFTGAKDESGSSWCPDCNAALPHVEKAYKEYGKDLTFVYVDVGNREYWKNMTNPFRLDKDIHLMVIPTLIRWKKPQRLEGDHCAQEELLEMFFENEEN